MATMPETNALITQLGAMSYLGIFGVSLLANMIIPVPEEIVLLSLGYLVGTGHLNPYILIPIVMAGLLISDSVIYYLASRGNKFVQFLYDKFFSKKLELHTVWLQTHIDKVVFFARFLIQLRFLGPFLAGQQNIGFKRFVKFDALAILVYVPLYIAIGWFFNKRIGFILNGINLFKNAVLIVIGITLLIAFTKFMNRLIFGPFTLSYRGLPEEKTWFPGVYKIRKK